MTPPHASSNIQLRPLARPGETPTPTPAPLTPTTLTAAEGSCGNPDQFPTPSARSLPDSNTHGSEPEPEGETTTVDESSSTNLEEVTPDGTMAPKPPSLRTTPGYSSPSYGAISSETQGRAARDDHGASSSSSTVDPEDEPPLPNMSRTSSRDALSGSRTLRSRRSTRFSEEVGGTTIIGGPEGRFGVGESAMPTDIFDDTKLSSDDGSDAGLLEEDHDADADADYAEFDEDPPDNSPYPQVRASVAPTDNLSLSINTPRMWTLSVLFSILGSSTNLFFSLRYPSVAITPVIALLLVHPLGLLWDFLLKRADDPPEEYIDGFRAESPPTPSSPDEVRHTRFTPYSKRSRLGRFRLWLTQGRWNEKEHSCVYVSSNVSFGFAFATDVIVEQTRFYKQDVSITYQLLLTLSTQILGYTFAGLTRRFLVRPSGMIWPGTLMSAAMFTTLHKEENKEANGWRISRWKFFYIIWTGAFLFYFLPGLLMPALSYFNVITWFAPDNVVVANLFGVVSGLGLFPLTFDWAQIAYIGSPLLTPFWAAMNVVGGLVVVMWIIAPIAYYGNWLYASYMPILSAAVFDNTGNVYDVSRILTKDFLFDKDAYQNYSRVFLPITYVLSYGVQFAGLASLLTHTACWHGKDIWTQWKRSITEVHDEEPTPLYRPVSNSGGEPSTPRSHRRHYIPGISSSTENLMSREDVHNRLMRRYKDAPMWWYLVTFISMTAVGIFVVE